MMAPSDAESRFLGGGHGDLGRGWIVRLRPKCLVPSVPPARARPHGRTPGVFCSSGFEGLHDPHVSHHDGEGVHEGVLREAEQAAPAPSDATCGRVSQ